VDPDYEPDVELLTDTLTILKSIRHFWTSIEKDLGSFEEFGDVDIDEVTPRSLAVLQMCIDAYVAGLPPSEWRSHQSTGVVANRHPLAYTHGSAMSFDADESRH
jgi:hypothetical protein